jgi:DNA-binding transcriptional MerR regulator
MTPTIETYDLNELSAAADVTPRTIRYYVQQGLLPSPGTRGPGTRYDRAHLDRLHLIRRLQRQHLPLAEIRRRLEALDDEHVRGALASLPEAPSGSSALDYVREVLLTQSASPVPPEDVPRPRSMGVLHPRMASLHSVRSSLGVEPTETRQPNRSTRSTWERIPLAPDVELHVRRPLSREQNRQVERLIEAARDLFAEEP